VPPKCKFFAWLIMQNRVWTADRLQHRGWENCGNCHLCNQLQETADHLMYKCRFTLRVWKEILVWCAIHDRSTESWSNEPNVDAWWTNIALGRDQHRKALASLLMLISWEAWKERNARVFRHHHSATNAIIAKIKDEARAWCLASAKELCNTGRVGF
jgi:hypothetical protein